MATRQKTIQHAFSPLASLTNNTLTNLTTTTIYIPESSPTFRSVTAKVTFNDIITVTGGSLTTKTLNLQLGAAGYSSVANANTLTHAGRNIAFYLTADYTSYFASNWSGTSMTCDFQLQINQSTGTTLGMVNVCVVLEITYDYDDTSATHIKTVVIPLDGPVGAVTNVSTTYDTIPALGYYLAEGSKVFRNIFVEFNANCQHNAVTSDKTVTLEVGTANITTGIFKDAINSDTRIRYAWELSASWPSTTATQAYKLSTSVNTHFHHPSSQLVVTYEFKGNAAATTLTAALADGTGTTVSVTDATKLGTAPYVISIDNEQMLVTSVASNDLTVTRAYNGTTGVAHSNGATVSPCSTNSVQLTGEGISGSLGSTTSSDYQRFTSRFYIEEPGPITANKIAFNLGWQATAAVSSLQVRVGTGSFVAYTDAAADLSGDNVLMCRNDAAFTLARGLNTLTFDAYTSGSTNIASGFSGYWIINYVSSLSASGPGAHNQTRRYTIRANGTGAVENNFIATAAAPPIPESDYYISSAGVQFIVQTSTSATGSIELSAERLVAEGGVRWDPLLSSALITDQFVGAYFHYGSLGRWVKKWPADTWLERFDIETARRYRFRLSNPASSATFSNLQVWYTYHTCGPFTVADNVTGSDGGTVTIGLYRSSDGQLLKSTTRSGNGAYSFNWWDNTENVFTACTDATGNTARSKDGVASGSP